MVEDKYMRVHVMMWGFDDEHDLNTVRANEWERDNLSVQILLNHFQYSFTLSFLPS